MLEASGTPSGPGAVDTVLRWLVGQLLQPATADQGRVGAQVLAAGLVAAPVEAAPEQDAVVPVGVEARPSSGLGWPG